MITFAQRSKIQITNLDDCHMRAAINGTGTDYPAKAPKFSAGFQSDSCSSILSFLYNVLQIIVCPFFCPFRLAIVSYVLLQLMASDYSFGILKLFVRGIHVPRSLVFCVMFCRSCDINCSIFLAVQKYIKNTCRFSMS